MNKEDVKDIISRNETLVEFKDVFILVASVWVVRTAGLTVLGQQR